MRILLVSAYGLPHMGGIEVAVDALASKLSERGHSVTHVTSSAGTEAREPARGYSRVRIPALNLLEARFGVPYPLFSPALITTLRKEIAKADVVHTHGYIYPGSVTAAALCRRTSPPTPLVLTEHVGHVPYDSALIDGIEAQAIRALGLRVLRRAGALVTYNSRVAEQLTALCPSISQRTILNGVDTDLFRPTDDEDRRRLRAALGWDDRPQVLFVGRPVAKKGFEDAVSAVTDADPSDIGLAVAGSEKLPGGAPDRVTALGPLPRARLAEIYRACDAMIVPARGEGFPLSAQEALASGLPLLVADDPGYAPNLVGAGPAVRLVGDPAEFPAALTTLLGDPASLREARRAAAAHARKAFSWARASAEHETLYEELVSAQRGAHGP
jgi:glycosyltransferase involved in cell wall biosynthesis